MKTKGKRSATKLECVITTGTPESERDHKWGAQHRTNTEGQMKVIASGEAFKNVLVSHSFRLEVYQF